MASVFSGKSGRNTAIWTAQQLQNQQGELQGIAGATHGAATDYLKGGHAQALKDLNKYYPISRNDITGALDKSQGYITQGRDASLAALQGGYGAAIGDVNKYYGQSADVLKGAAAGFDPLVQSGLRGLQMYENSLGLGGAEGTAAAQGAFKAGPGYQWQVDQATGAASRAANKMGGAYGGNATSQISTLASNLANQEYGNWQKHLQGFQGAAQNAVSGQAGVLADLANTYEAQGGKLSDLNVGLGRDQSSVYTNAATGLSNNQMQAGQTLAQLASNQGTNLANLNYTHGQSMAANEQAYGANLMGINQQYYGGLIPAGQAGMQAGQQAAGNRMGAIMGGLQLGASLLGGGAGGGGGSLFSSLWGGK